MAEVARSVTSAIAVREQAEALLERHRHAEAIVVFDDLLDRFGLASETSIREQVAFALLGKAKALENLGESEDAIAVYDDIINRFGSASETPIRERVVLAFLGKGWHLWDHRRYTEAIAVGDELIGRFHPATEISIGRMVARANYLIASSLRHKGWDGDDTEAAYDDLISRFGTTIPDARVGKLVAIALIWKGGHLIERGCYTAAIAVFNDLISRFDNAIDEKPKLPEARFSTLIGEAHKGIAEALLKKGDYLTSLGCHQEAIAVYDDLITRSERRILIHEQVASALLKKGDVLIDPLARHAEAIATYDELIGRFDSASETSLQIFVAIALRKKGDALFTPFACSSQAIATYDDLIGRFGKNTDKSIREQVDMARISRLRVASTTAISAVSQQALSRTAQYHAYYGEVHVVHTGDVFQGISNSTIVSRSKVEGAFNQLQNSGQADGAEILVELGKRVSDANNVAAGAVYGQMTEELSKPTHDKRLLKTYWDGLVAILPSLAQLSAEVVKAFGI